MLPAILAIQDDRHERRLLRSDGVADVGQVAHEIVGRIFATAALILKADHVAERVIAEDDCQFVRHLPSPCRRNTIVPDCGRGRGDRG